MLFQTSAQAPRLIYSDGSVAQPDSAGLLEVPVRFAREALAAGLVPVLSGAPKDLYHPRAKYRPLRRTGVLTKGWAGKLVSLASGADVTSQIRTVLEAPASMIRIGILNCVGATITGVKASVGKTATAGTSDGSTTDNNAASYLDFTWASAASTSLPTGTVTAPTITWCDWLNLGTSLPRTDPVGGLQAYSFRVEIPAANANIPVYNYTDTTGWKQDNASTFGRFWRMRKQAVLAATAAAQASFTTTTDASQVIPIIIQYQPVGGSGFTVVVIGDSWDESSAGGTLRHCGWHQIARNAISTPQFPIEICNLAQSGLGFSLTTGFNSVVTLADNLPELQAEFMVCPIGSINNQTSAITQTTMDVREIGLGLVRRYAGKNNVRLIHRTWAPVDPSNGASFVYDGSDALRRAANAAILASEQDVVLDFDSLFAGRLNSAGQMLPIPELMNGVHPNQAGELVGAAAFSALLSEIKAAMLD